MKERRHLEDDQAMDGKLLAIKELWEIEPPPELLGQIMQRLPAQAERQHREFFGLVAWAFGIVLLCSGLLTSAAFVYSRQSRDWMLAMFWGGVGL